MNLPQLDRRLGAGLRRALGRIPAGEPAARLGAAALAPAVEGIVALAIALPASRGLGLRMLVAGGSAAIAARLARDAIGRPRPGPRAQGGFPSRHAAAATAIAIAGRGHRPWGRLVAALGAAGLACRVASGEHEPGDILGGAAVGAIAGALARRASLPADG